MNSPLTGKANTILIDTFSVNAIVEKYYSDLGIRVNKYFHDLKEVQLYECGDTSYKFYYPFNIFGDGDFYAQLNKINTGYYIEERWEHTVALSFLKEGMNVLEIGCGEGSFLKLMAEEGVIATGLELNEDAVKKGKENGLNIISELIDSYSKKYIANYDAVCFFQVLEHITDVKNFLNEALLSLKPGGLLIIGVPHNNPYIFKHDKWHTLNLPPHHAGLWNRESFEKLEHFFPVHLKEIKIEPLLEPKEWFIIQREHYLKKKPFLGFLLSLIPRPIYKATIKLVKNKIEGRNILAVFTKKGNE